MKTGYFKLNLRSSKKEQLSVNLGKFLGGNNNGGDNVYPPRTVLEREVLKRCTLCSTYKNRVPYTHFYILYFIF